MLDQTHQQQLVVDRDSHIFYCSFDHLNDCFGLINGVSLWSGGFVGNRIHVPGQAWQKIKSFDRVRVLIENIR